MREASGRRRAVNSFVVFFPLMTLVFAPDSLSCNYFTVPGPLSSEMLWFYGLMAEERAGEPCTRVRLFRKLVPAGCEALFADGSRFFRDEKKWSRHHLGFPLDSETRKTTFGWRVPFVWLYADDARVCVGPNTTVEGHPLLQPAEREPPLKAESETSSCCPITGCDSQNSGGPKGGSLV